MTAQVFNSQPITIISCEEYGHVWVDPASLIGASRELILDSDVDGRNAFSVDFFKGKMRVRASSLVGVIPLNDHVVLKVRPRVPIANLTKMVHETGHRPEVLRAFREYRGGGSATRWIMDMYAEAFLDHVDEVLNLGIYRTYQRQASDGSFPHGRINFNRTIGRHAARGIQHRVAFEWFERIVDNAPNQCLKLALICVHRHLTTGPLAKGHRSMLQRVTGQVAAFDDVSMVDATQLLQDPDINALRPLPDTRAYYRGAIDVALMIIKRLGVSLEKEGRDVRLPSMLIEMNTLFESYIRTTLQREASSLGWPVEVLDGNKDGSRPLYRKRDPLPAPLGTSLGAMFEGQGAIATPDIVFRLPGGDVPLVAEVKNIAKGGVLPERSEVNQAVTYAVRYGLKSVLLIRPLKSGTAGLIYCGTIGDVDVFDYKVNLGAPDLDSAAADLAAAVGSLMSLGLK